MNIEEKILIKLPKINKEIKQEYSTACVSHDTLLLSRQLEIFFPTTVISTHTGQTIACFVINMRSIDQNKYTNHITTEGRNHTMEKS